jgi:hypothetical protein
VGGRADGEPFAVGTIRRIHSVLHASLAQAQRWSGCSTTLRPELPLPRTSQWK